MKAPDSYLSRQPQDPWLRRLQLPHPVARRWPELAPMVSRVLTSFRAVERLPTKDLAIRSRERPRVGIIG